MDIYSVYSDAWKIFIRPERFTYTQINLGFPNRKFGNVNSQRIDMTINNNRGHDLKCSLYEPQGVENYPVVVYLHGNSGNRREAMKIVELLLP